MRRRDLLKLYATETVIDAETGKKKRVSRYVGKSYRMDKAVRRGCQRLLWPCWGASLIAFAVGGLLPTKAGYSTYVVVWYMACLLPLFYLLMGAVRMSRMGDTLTEVDLKEGVNYVKGGTVALIGLGGAWTVADVIFLIIQGLPERPAADLVFLLCGALTTAMGILLRRKASQLKAEEIKEENGADVEHL